MAVTRVSAVKVKELIETNITDEVVGTNMLMTANRYVTTHLTGKGLTADTLADIELYLAAHLVALTEERGAITWSELGDSRERYADIYMSGLNSTRYGQQAVVLDTSGTLANIGAPKMRAQFRVV